MALSPEINTLRNLSATVLPKETKYFLQRDLKISEAGSLTIKRMSATYGDEITSKIIRNTFDYRFIFYSKSELDVQEQAERVGDVFSRNKKIPIMGENAWLTLGSFSTSESFETEKTGVFAIIGMINTVRYEVKSQEDAEKLQRIYVRYQEEIKL